MTGILAIFDFDHTIIDANSDVVLRDLLPNEVLQSKKLKGLRPSWTAYMAEVFRQLPLAGINKEKILETCKNLAPNEGIIDLFHYLCDLEAEIVIVSDANSELINSWMNYNLPNVAVQTITNPAVWGVDEVLKVKPFQQQTTCKQCPINMCKGSVLTKLLADRNYKLVVYTGDGKNDFCPAQKLRPCDLVCARKKFQLETLLEKSPIDAKICIWATGATIRQEIDTLVNFIKK